MALTTPRTGFQMPASSEVDEFTDQVDEACRLIAGLQTGAISPEAFDRTERSKAEAKAAKQAKEAQEASKQAAAAQPQADPEKQEQLKQKVADLQRNRQRKEQARQRFDAYIAHKKATHETDYTKWDLFTPEDEEDDLINSLTPNNPQMKALEADIDARHARMVSQRQLAERQRVQGNTLYAQGQYTAAFQCYETGLEAEKHNMALHGNAAQVLIKMGCFAQAIEHCDKVLHLAEFLHNKPTDPMCAKALWRRAAARKALQHYNEAVQDLQQALKLEPSSKAFAKELDTVRKDCAEARKQRAVLKQLNGNSNLSSQLNTAATPSDAAGSIANPHRNSPPSRAGTKTATSGQSASHPAEPKNGIAYSGNAAAQSRSAVQIADANQSAAQLNTTDQPVQSTSAVKADMQPAESAVRQGMQPVQSASFSLTTAQPQTGSKAASNLARMETLVLVLQTAMLGVHQQEPSASSNKAAQAHTPAGLGKPLPKQAGSHATSNQAQGVEQICKELSTLMQADDDCRVYLRESKGLACLSSLVSQAAGSDVVSVLRALTAACQNDYNCKWLAKQGTVQAALKLLHSQSHASVFEVLCLLYAMTTEEEARLVVGQACANTDRDSATSAVAQLFAILLADNAGTQAMALMLLGNIATQSAVLQAVKACCGSPGSSELQSIVNLMVSRDASLVTKAATLLGNLSHNAALRQQIGSSKPAVAAVLAILGKHVSQLQQHDKTAAQSCKANTPEAVGAAATMLQNVLLDKEAQRLVASLHGIRIITGLLQATDLVLLTRATGSLSRVAQLPESQEQVVHQGSVAAMLTLLRRDVSKPDEATWQSQIVESVARTLATLTATDTAAVDIIASAGLEQLLQLLKSPTTTSAALGNLSLCIGNMAKQTSWLPTLREAGAVASLLDVAYKQKGAVQKNAAIAVARLAHDPVCMQQIKELHGLEIIYQYVRP